MTHILKLDFYKDYDSLHQIIDNLDSIYQYDLSVRQVVLICLQNFPCWAIEQMVNVTYHGTDWVESKLFQCMLKNEAAKLYPSNNNFKSH